MAKSIRSKWRRKCRAVKRVRYSQKELERLKKTVSNDPCNKPADVDMSEISEIATVVDKAAIKSKKGARGTDTQNNTEEMETDKQKRVFSSKTMRDQHGTYPIWMHQRRVHKQKKAGKGKQKKKSKK